MLTDEDKQWITAQLAAQLAVQLEEIHRRIERVETTLLSEFHKWAGPVEMRVRSHAAALRALDLEIEAVEDRVTKIERSPNS